MLSKAAQKRIKGKLPKKRDVVDWSEEKLSQFLKFIVFFTHGENFVFNNVSWETARLKNEPFWDEFMLRIDCAPGQQKFRTRFITQQRTVMAWVKENPHVLTEDMYKLCQSTPRLSWATTHFKTVDTEMGVQVVERDTDELTDPRQKNATDLVRKDRTPQVIYEEGLLSMTTLFRQLARSVPSSEIKGIKPEQRIALANQMAKTLRESFKKFQPNIRVFNNININKSTREELEGAVLSYAEEQE